MTAGLDPTAARADQPDAGAIRRDPAGAARERFDLIVVGGGVFGILTALEATRRGLRPLLLERADFAGATSHNSLRIVHGGLRYLQSLALGRSLESIRERAWWLAEFPELVRPLPCLMPLYGAGLRRPEILRLGLLLNDLLGRLPGNDAPLPRGSLVDAAAVQRLAPAVARVGLRGGALWFDGVIRDPARLFIEALRRACAAGACALNHLEALRPTERDRRVAGVEGRDCETGAQHVFHAPVVINAAGPWSRSFAATAGADQPALFEPVLAWNVALRRRPSSEHALALQAKRRGAYFLVPTQDGMLAGTGYAPWPGEAAGTRLPQALLDDFIAELNTALPGLALRRQDVIRTYVGRLPAARAGTAELSDRAVLVDHGKSGRLRGFYSISGVKLTTARALAQRVLGRAFPEAHPLPADRLRPPLPIAPAATVDNERWQRLLQRSVDEEAALHLDDLLLRRCGLGDDPARARAMAPVACRLLGWPAERSQTEIARLEAALALVQPAAELAASGF
jgi:glycerol-3-phosphate dehydrogenase